MESVLSKPMCVSRIRYIVRKTSMSRARKSHLFILKERSLSSEHHCQRNAKNSTTLPTEKALTQKEKQILYLIPTLWMICCVQRNGFFTLWKLPLCERWQSPILNHERHYSGLKMFDGQEICMADNLAGKECLFYLNHNTLLLPCWWMDVTQMFWQLHQVTEGWNVLPPVDIQVN